MTKKYIVKNCPACYLYGNKYSCEDNHDEQGRDTYCQNIDDCIIKQLVEKCKEHRKFMCSEKYRLCERVLINDRHEQKYPVEDEILQLFTIEEVE